MKNLRPLAFFFASFLFPFPNSWASDTPMMSEYLPADSLFAWEIDDLASFKEDLSECPWGEVADFPAWIKMRDWMTEKWEDELSKSKEKGMRGAEDFYEQVYLPMYESMNGGLAMAIGQIEKSFKSELLKWENENGGKARWRARCLPQVTLLAQSSLSEDEFEEIIDSMSNWIKSNQRIRTVMEKSLVAGVQVHWVGNAKNEELTKISPKDTMIAFAFHNGMILALTGGEDHVEETILRLQGKSKDSSLADSVSFQDSFDEIEKGQARAFLNFKKIFSLDKQMEKVKGFEIPENPFGVTMQGLIDGLGFKGLDHLAMQVDLKDKGFFVSQGLFMNEREGMLAMLKPVDAEAELYDFCPKDAFSVSSVRFDLAEIWPILEKTLASISPGLGLLVNAQIQAFEDQAKLSLRKDLFGSLGDEMLSLSYLNQTLSGEKDWENPSSTIYALSLKDSQLFDRTLRSLFDSVTQGSELFEEREHQGVLVRSMRGLEGMGISLSYAVSDQWLLLSMGEDQYLNQLINRMKRSKAPLWEEPHLREALDILPSRVRQIDYVNLSQMFPFFSSMLGTFKSDMDMKIDMELSPSDFGDFPYFMLGWSMDREEGMISKVGLFPIRK